MEYKLSDYIYFDQKDEDTYMCMHLISKAMFGLSADKYQLLQDNKDHPEKILAINPNLFNALVKLEVIIKKEFDEKSLLIAAHRSVIYSNDTFRLTILPTLECNFKCWYCYEERVPGKMSEETANSLLLYVKNHIFNSGIKVFHLDWFGGEPLLYFDQVVYPISRKIKELCAEHHVDFINMITTNGALITPEMIEKIKEIGLNSYQITLDGNEEQHNKIKKSSHTQNAYRQTLDNIFRLIDSLNAPSILLRINYTEKNFKGVPDIIQDIPEAYRDKMEVSLQQVWQTKEKEKDLDVVACNDKFCESGFNAPLYTLDTKCYHCYADLKSQMVVNYNGDVFKCTARDFANHKPDGKLTSDGQIEWDTLYYQRLASTTIEFKECLDCKLLPACWGPCSQKVIEHKTYGDPTFEQICNKGGVEETIRHKINEFYEKEILEALKQQ